MRQCTFCFEIKERSEFSSKHGRCNSCRAAIARHKTLAKRGVLNMPAHMLRPVNFVVHLCQSYDGKLLELPVKALYHNRPKPNGCVLLNRDGRDLLIVQSYSLQKAIPLDDVGPLDILTILSEAGLELIIPESFRGDSHGGDSHRG